MNRHPARSGIPVHLKRKLWHALLALFTVIGLGTGGYMLIEDWPFFDALFHTLITITTVGYDDGGMSDNGRHFTLLLLIFGIATATYGFSSIIQVAVSSQLAWGDKMQEKIDTLKNHFIICGYGRVGETVCEQLAEAGQAFVIIERDEQRCQVAEARGFLAIHGDATEDEKLQQAGIDRAQGLASVVDSDAENIVIALSARELNKYAFIMSRAEKETSIRKIERAGASLVISPFRTSGNEIANAIIRPHVAHFLRHSLYSNADFVLGEVTLQEGSSLVERTFGDYGKEEPEVVFVAVERGRDGLMLRPGGNEVFQAGDVVMVVGPPEALVRMREQAQPVPLSR